MTRLLSIVAAASLGSALAACSVSTRGPAVSAVGSSTAPDARAQPVDQTANACEQELGSDTGGIVEAAVLIPFGAVDGCVTSQDEVDGFIVHIEDDMPLQIKLKSQNDYGSIHVEVFDVDGGKLADENARSFETKSVRLEIEGETDLFIRLRARGDGEQRLGRYRLIVGPDKKLARR